MKISDIQILIKIAELQSITAAAKHFGISVSSASVSLKRVEAALGVDLVVRTTRKLRLTIEGERFIPICSQALLLLQKAQNTLNEEQHEISGEVRLAVSSEMGRNLMRILLDNVIESHNSLSLKLYVSDGRADFYKDNVDVALRDMVQTEANESNLYGFKIANIPHILCASPSYIAKQGEPMEPEDLVSHNILLYKIDDVIHDGWELLKKETKHRVKVKGNRTSNDSDIVRRWCVEGFGISKKSALDVANDLLEGRVKRLMPCYQFQLTELWLLLPSRQLITPSIRLIRDELKQEIKKVREKLLEEKILSSSEWPL
ncbi:LysR family transcriptional regulator [Vibrio jasicida]|uniref:LysR family transcriptional regulator n=1 Tax=Vibrio jasicida TaxID=766224 RepID=UPI0003A8CF3F|nr:LysR family transcriptional regulator [Vibrio jasicida]